MSPDQPNFSEPDRNCYFESKHYLMHFSKSSVMHGLASLTLRWDCQTVRPHVFFPNGNTLLGEQYITVDNDSL